MIIANSISKAVLLMLLLAPAANGSTSSATSDEQEFIFKEEFNTDVIQGSLRRGLQQASCSPTGNPQAVWVCGTPGMRNSGCANSNANCDSLPAYACQCNGTPSTCSYCRVQMSSGVICQKSGSSTTFTDRDGSLTSCACNDAGNGQAVQECRALAANSTPLEDARPTFAPVQGVPAPPLGGFPGTPPPVPVVPGVAPTATPPQAPVPAQNVIVGTVTSSQQGGTFPTFPPVPGVAPTATPPRAPIPAQNVIVGTVTSPQGGTFPTGGTPTVTPPTPVFGQQPTSPRPPSLAGLGGATVIQGTPTTSFGARVPTPATAPVANTFQGPANPVSGGKSPKKGKRNARFSRISALP